MNTIKTNILTNSVAATDSNSIVLNGGWNSKRKPSKEDDTQLTPASINWLQSLPESIRPACLVDKYPRIVNKISHTWILPFNCNKYLDQLTIRQRENRQGFPPEIFKELLKLSVYCKGR